MASERQIAKQILRAMVKYAQTVAKKDHVSYSEAVRSMNEHPAPVARDLHVSEAFVVAWTRESMRPFSKR